MTLIERILIEAHWPDEYIADDVKKLLDKTEEREMDHEFHGYPSDFLGKPGKDPVLKTESLIYSLIDGNEYFTFEMLRFENNDASVSSILNGANTMCRFSVGNSYAYISKDKLKWLLLDHKESIDTYSSDKWLIRLPKQVLLDHADKLD